MFLLPGLVMATYVTGAELRPEQKLEMIRYLRNRVNDDGGWGLYAILPSMKKYPANSFARHIEGTSSIFGTAMNYVALRLLGVEKDDPLAKKSRRFLHANGIFPFSFARDINLREN